MVFICFKVTTQDRGAVSRWREVAKVRESVPSMSLLNCFLIPRNPILESVLARTFAVIEIVRGYDESKNMHESTPSWGKTSGVNISTGRLPSFIKMVSASPASIRTVHKGDKFAERQRKSPVVKTARVLQVG